MLGSTPALEQPLLEAGLDSLGAVELRNSLAVLFGIDLPATVTFDHPTAATLGTFIAGARSTQSSLLMQSRILMHFS
jgi:acyl carrier protein